MRLEPTILGRHLEAAAIEQVSAELEREGFRVERNDRALPQGFRPDVVARRGDETLIIEVKVIGTPAGSAGQAARLARDLGAKFRLVMVRPPSDRHAEVEGIEHVLEDALSKPIHPDLDALSARTEVRGVHDVEIESLDVRDSGIEVTGSGTVSVILHAEGGTVEVDRVDLPFTFEARLGPDRKPLGAIHVEVDASAWYGDTPKAV